MDTRWKSEAIKLLGYASGILEGTAYQVQDSELKEKLLVAVKTLKEGTDKVMSESL